MYVTAEVRWFFDGRVPSQVHDWFVTTTGATEVPEIRTDRYLLLPGTTSIGLKLRQHRFEIKIRSFNYGPVKFSEGTTGRVERWGKWSFNLDQNGDAIQEVINKDLGWLDVRKERLLGRYVIERETVVSPLKIGEQTSSGCQVELTELELKGQKWWTFAFESFGERFILLHNLVHSSRKVLKTVNPFLLIDDQSFGYPQWIQDAFG